MAENFKERFDIAVGKTVDFVTQQKDKAVEYLDSKQKLYKAKTALTEANKKLDKLFYELGRVTYYKKSDVPERTSADIRKEIKELLANIEVMQIAYDSLTPADTASDADEE